MIDVSGFEIVFRSLSGTSGIRLDSPVIWYCSHPRPGACFLMTGKLFCFLDASVVALCLVVHTVFCYDILLITCITTICIKKIPFTI